MDAYVISLNESKKLIGELTELGFNVHLTRGINGKIVPEKEILKKVAKHYAIFGPKSSIGCAMSHIKVWEKFLESDKETAVVFEDDIITNEYLTPYVINEIISNTPDDFDLLYLGWFGASANDNIFSNLMGILGVRRDFQEINDLIIVPKVSLGLHGYVLSRKGAQKLRESISGKLWNHVDYCIQELSSKEANKLQVYCLKDRLVYQTSTSTLNSSNVGSCHPRVFQELLSHIEVDHGVVASYLTTVAFARLGGSLQVNLTSVMFLIFGIIAALLDIKLHALITFFIVLSVSEFSLTEMQVWFHLLLIILPSAIKRK